ncbi:MAG: metallophosphoesterase family protein [Promethearchaeota archaeon]
MTLSDQEIINKYRSKLRAANVLESQDPQYASEKLQECVELLGQLENSLKRHKLDKTTLEKRITRLHSKNISADIVAKEEAVEEPVIEEKLVEEPKVEEVVAEEPKVEEIIVEEKLVEEPKVEEETVEETPLYSSTQFEIPYHAKVIDPLPDIFQEVYSGLMNDRTLEYQDYLTFYESVNDLNPNPFPPIIYQESNVSFYVGDTHGAFSETQIIVHYFERILAQSTSKSIKIIFLGDYVDRNPNDLENLTLIIAFWLKYPENVMILRGNHEDIKINQYYGFIKNLTDTFVIEEWVKNLYQEILNMFVKLPVAHVGALQNLSDASEIRVFSAHGGIPIDSDNFEKTVNLIDLFTEIETNSTSFEEFDKYMNWLLWADPKEGRDDIILHPETGRNQFGLKSFNKFMEINNLQFMVRAHEVLEKGYKYFFDSRLISLFTASTYKNRPIGKAAFIRLEKDKTPVILSTDPDMLDMDYDYWSKTLS